MPLRVKICGRRKRRCQTVAIQGIQSTIQLKASDKNGHMILVTLFLKEYDRENMSRDFCVFRTDGNNYTRLIVPRQLFENRYTRSITTSKKMLLRTILPVGQPAIISLLSFTMLCSDINQILFRS